MSEKVREHIDTAMETAVATGADLDEVEAMLEDAQHRVDQLRAMRGDA